MLSSSHSNRNYDAIGPTSVEASDESKNLNSSNNGSAFLAEHNKHQSDPSGWKEFVGEMLMPTHPIRTSPSRKCKSNNTQFSLTPLTSDEEVTSTRGCNKDATTKTDSKSYLGLTPREDNTSSQNFEFLWMLLTGNRLNLLLLLMPLAYTSFKLQWSPTLTFWLNFCVMLPLGNLLGDFTEELALHTNDTIGGLINASFGNAVEVLVSLQALLANEIRVVQASLMGSIFSNLLLVQGCSFFFGGLKFKEQRFNSIAATANSSLLMLSSLGLILPTPYASYNDISNEEVLVVSRITAIFMLMMYLQLLLFQLVTHKDIFDDDSDDKPTLSFRCSMVCISLLTLLVAVFSEYLVDSIAGFADGCNLSRTFVGIIILPIIGNCVEHISAVSMAMRNKIDLAMGIAIGSCTQIGLFVVPMTVLIGWACGKDMTLNYPHYEIGVYFLAILISIASTGSGTTNWLAGSLLVTTYLMLAVGFFYEKVEDF